jgi:hypothetical protein
VAVSRSCGASNKKSGPLVPTDAPLLQGAACVADRSTASTDFHSISRKKWNFDSDEPFRLPLSEEFLSKSRRLAVISTQFQKVAPHPAFVSGFDV